MRLFFPGAVHPLLAVSVANPVNLVNPVKIKTLYQPPAINRLICLGLALVTSAVYWPVATFDFTDYDEPNYIYQNPIVCGGLSLRGLLWALSTSYFDFWHPLTWWSHILDCELFGLRPGWHHLVNLGFHVANMLLLFTVLRQMTGALWRSAIVAALFALHPLHVESVVWLAERKDVLSTFFFMLTLWAYGKYAELHGSEFEVGCSMFSVRPSESVVRCPRIWYFTALFLFALGLMSKPMLVTLPFVLLLLDYWPLRRSFSSSLHHSTTPPLRLLFEKVPFFALSAASCLITLSGMKANLHSADEVPWSFRLPNIPVSYVRYLGKMIWPANLTVLYPRPDHWEWWQVADAALVLLLITLLVLLRARSAPYLVFGWLMFLGTLTPTLGLVSQGFHSIADRYTYFPSIGLFVAVVWAVARGESKVQSPKSKVKFGVGSSTFGVRPSESVVRGPLLGGAAAVALLTCACLTWTQLQHWRNSLTLWTHCVAVTRNNAIAHYNLAHVFEELGRQDKALAEYREAIRAKPDYVEANLNLGAVLFKTGNLCEATNWFAMALRLKPDHALAQRDLGVALLELGDFSGAIRHLTEAIRLDPNDFVAFAGLGRAWSAQGRSDQAVRCYAEALSLDPAYVEAHYYLGLEWLKRGQFEEAVSNLGEAVRLAPARADAHFQLGIAFTGKRATGEAIAQYRAAIRLDPNSPAALNNLAWILATHPEAEFRNGPEAVQLAKRTCELTSFGQTVFIGTLAAAYAESGEYEKAVETAQKARDLAFSLGQTNLFERNQKLVRRFQAHEPYRE